MNTFDSTLGKPGCWTCTSWSYYKSKDRDRLVSCMVCHDRSTWRTLQSGSNQRIVTVTLLSLPYRHPQINIWFSSWSRQQVVTVELLSSNYDPSYLNEIISGGGYPPKYFFENNFKNLTCWMYRFIDSNHHQNNFWLEIILMGYPPSK